MPEAQHILVADDSRPNVVLLERALQKAGYRVSAAEDGFKAVDLAVTLRPDLVLLDLMMPGRDGVETCTILKSKQATGAIPVIFVTADAEPGSVVKAFAAGGCDYITKPIRIDELLARVSVHLRLRQAERDLTEKNAQLAAMSEQLAENNLELDRLSRVDSLTGLFNRRAWDEATGMEHDRSERHQHVYSVLMIDVDCFKALNDEQGHPAGDECLRRLARQIASTCRGGDLVGRYGGEEFTVLAPETDLEGASALAERIRQAVWDMAIPHRSSPPGRVTVSIGVAARKQESLAEVVKKADVALYRAKRAGRNIVHAHSAIIPACDAPRGEADGAAELTPAETSETEQTTVLVVDDEAASRQLCKSCLLREGYRVREAINGRVALSEVEREPPDVILMDVKMPEVDGLTCTRRLKAGVATRDIPIILVSAAADTSDIVAGLEAGADEYITKPFRIGELAARVRSMTRLYHEERDLLRSYQLRAEQVRVLSVLLDLCRVVGTAAVLDEVLDATIAAVAEVTGCRRVSIMLPDADGSTLTIAKATGIDEALAASISVPVGAAIAGKVFATREPVVINAETDPGLASDRYDTQFFVSVPLLSLPLRSTAEMVGVLNLTERVGRRPFEPRELEYIELIANIAGGGLDAFMTRHARDQARDLIMVALAKLAEHRDNDTARHVERVTEYAVVLAEELRTYPRFTGQIDEEFIVGLRRAVPLHDIGKVAVPDAILRKPARLSLEEMRIMRSHAVIGAETLLPVLQKAPKVKFLRMAYDIIYDHHEWYDGSGYPKGLKGEEIPLAARIVALADVYDALTTKRVYKEAIDHEAAMQTIVPLSGSQFDPAVVQAFVQCEQQFRRLAGELADHGDSPLLDAKQAYDQTTMLRLLDAVTSRT